MKKYILVGLGPHARRIHYNILEKHQSKYGIRIQLLIELADQKEKIYKYLQTKKMQPKKIVFLDEKERSENKLSKKVSCLLDQTYSKHKIDGIIISTEPKSHKKYAIWALRKNIDILMDKPIIAPIGSSVNLDSARKIYTDFCDLKKELKKSTSSFIILCQRRYHPGFLFIKNYAKQIAKQYNIPITYMDIYNANGMWNMPNEFLFRENHSYKYGYGKLMHSGYQSVDLYAWLIEVNDSIRNKKTDSITVYATSYRPKDFLSVMGEAFYQNYLPSKDIVNFFKEGKEKLVDNFGEIDVYIILQSLFRDNIINTSSLNLLQNSFSRRAWSQLPEDTYKGNGRLRHERLNLQLSHLVNIQMHSYQSYEVNKKDVEVTGFGAEGHFDVHVYRNSKLIGGKTLEKIRFGEKMEKKHKSDKTYMGHNERARENLILSFIKGTRSESDFMKHDFTNILLAKICECLVLEKKKRIPYIKFEKPL